MVISPRDTETQQVGVTGSYPALPLAVGQGDDQYTYVEEEDPEVLLRTGPDRVGERAKGRHGVTLDRGWTVLLTTTSGLGLGVGGS